MLSLAAASPANGDPGTTIPPANSATISPASIAEPAVPPSSVAEAAIAPAAIAPAAPTAVAPATTVPPAAGQELLLLLLELVKIERTHLMLAIEQACLRALFELDQLEQGFQDCISSDDPELWAIALRMVGGHLLLTMRHLGPALVISEAEMELGCPRCGQQGGMPTGMPTEG